MTLFISILSCSAVYATSYGTNYGTNYGQTSGTSTQIISPQTKSQLVQIKDKELKEVEDYKQAYGSDSYGLTAYMLNKVRIYSIPLCFIGIALAAIYQYIIGTKRLDTTEKGFGLMISITTIFVICQVLPLIFAIVVKSWRG